VLADHSQGVGDLARDAAGGAKDVPEEDEQTLPRRVEAGRDDRFGLQPPAPGEGERPEPGDFLNGATGQEVAQPLDGGRVNPAHRQGVEPLVEARTDRGAQLLGVLERVDRGRRPELAGQGRVDPLVDPPERRLEPDADA
jgi:hypothetical protein